MAQVKDVTLSIKTDTKQYKNNLEKCNKLAHKLNAQLEKLQNIEIGVTVVRQKKKWYQFWIND